jgi:hypothetical protein
VLLLGLLCCCSDYCAALRSAVLLLGLLCCCSDYCAAARTAGLLLKAEAETQAEAGVLHRRLSRAHVKYREMPYFPLAIKDSKVAVVAVAAVDEEAAHNHRYNHQHTQQQNHQHSHQRIAQPSTTTTISRHQHKHHHKHQHNHQPTISTSISTTFNSAIKATDIAAPFAVALCRCPLTVPVEALFSQSAFLFLIFFSSSVCSSSSTKFSLFFSFRSSFTFVLRSLLHFTLLSLELYFLFSCSSISLYLHSLVAFSSSSHLILLFRLLYHPFARIEERQKYDELKCDELKCDELKCDELKCDELKCDELNSMIFVVFCD